MPPATSICASWRSSAFCSLASTTATTSSSASASASSSTAVSPASRRQAMSVLGTHLVENMHRSNNYMALCQLHLNEREAMALIDRMKGVLASGAQAQPPRHRPAGGQQDLHHVAATGGLRLPELRRRDPQYRQLIPADPAGSAVSWLAPERRYSASCTCRAPVASGCNARVSRQMRMASGRQCSISRIHQPPPLVIVDPHQPQHSPPPD